MYVRTYVCAYVRTYACRYVHTYKRTYVHTYVQYTHMYVRLYTQDAQVAIAHL